MCLVKAARFNAALAAPAPLVMAVAPLTTFGTDADRATGGFIFLISLCLSQITRVIRQSVLKK
jgi:hypothetical protein